MNVELKTRRTDKLESESNYVLKNSHLGKDFKQTKYYNNSSIKDVKEKLENKLSLSGKLREELRGLNFKTKAIIIAVLSIVVLILSCVIYFKLKLWIKRIKSSLPCFTIDRPVPKKRKRQREQQNSRTSSIVGI